MKAINPYLNRMPPSLHDSFMDDFINTVTSLDIQQHHNSNVFDYKFNIPYKLMVAYARKAP